jgi:hypothetical protein
MAGKDETSRRLVFAGRKDEDEAPELVELTARIRDDQALALEILENSGRWRVGAAVDRDSLIQEALDLLIEKHIVAIDLREGKMVRQPDSASR